jgi:hypothetical protein
MKRSSVADRYYQNKQEASCDSHRAHWIGNYR